MFQFYRETGTSSEKEVVKGERRSLRISAGLVETVACGDCQGRQATADRGEVARLAGEQFQPHKTSLPRQVLNGRNKNCVRGDGALRPRQLAGGKMKGQEKCTQTNKQKN